MMIQALRDLAHFQISWASGLAAVAVLVLSFVLFNAAIIVFVNLLPADHFSRRREDERRAFGRSGFWFWCGKILKNAVGGLLILASIPLIFPGVPGPGLLLLIIGMSLIDFPGKRKLEYKLLSNPRLLHAINALRRRFHRSPLEL
jgi:hypothetical protein